jgi:hypothetical protein
MWGQANVNESLETAFIYVDTNTGSDSNPGTATQPLKTIGKAASVALSNNYKSIGSRVIINPGTYRESVTVSVGSASTSLPITFQAAIDGTATVSGADVWTGWTPYTGNPSIYTQTWPYTWGLCPASPNAPTEQDIMLRRELVIVNGTMLTEVLSLTAMQPGTFFPDESSATIYLWPPLGTNMSTATVEVSTRQNLFTDNGQSNIVLRGLTFKYGSTCNEQAAVTIDNNPTNILIDDDSFRWNNAMGLAMVGGVENFTVQFSEGSHNGEMGLHSHQVKNGLWQFDTLSYNSWRSAQGAFYAWDTGGAKFMLDHNTTYNNITAVFNQGHGAAFDTDIENAVLNSLVSVGNVGNGFFVEKGQGPISFVNGYFCGNNQANLQLTGGLGLRNSMAVTFTGNTFFNNTGAQLFVTGMPGGILITNWETGQIYNLVTSGMTSTQNVLSGPSTAQVFTDGFLGGADWTTFLSTLVSSNNTYWAGTNTAAWSVPVPVAWSNTNLSGWQGLTGQDSNSTWTSSGSPAACNISSQGADYWFLTNTVNAQTASPSGQAKYNVATLPLGGMTGTVNLSVDGLAAIPGATASFTPSSVSTSGTSSMTVFTGQNTPAGSYTLTMIANSGSLTRTITVSLIVPAVRVSAGSLLFGSQGLGSTSSPRTIQLSNNGATALTISSVVASANFAQTNTCGNSVAAGASCTISVTFSPTQSGTIRGTLTITDSDPTSPQVVYLSGTGVNGPIGFVSPQAMPFGDVKGGGSTTSSVTLADRGSADLSIVQVSVNDADSCEVVGICDWCKAVPSTMLSTSDDSEIAFLLTRPDQLYELPSPDSWR